MRQAQRLSLLARACAHSRPSQPTPTLHFAFERLFGDSNDAKPQPTQPYFHHCLRGFAATSAATSGQLELTNNLLQQAQVITLRQMLEDEAERALHIPYHRLVALCKSSGSADNDEHARQLISALHQAGVVLVQHDVVYLRPEEIAEVVLQILPGGREDTQRKLERIDEELLELEAKHLELEKAAHRYTSRFLWSGCLILASQLVAFIYLTWWELSWDVMEPIAYMISLFYTLMGYFYFLYTRGGVFDLKPFRDFWHRRIRQQKAAELKFDEQRYNYLLKLKDRYTRHLAHGAGVRL